MSKIKKTFGFLVFLTIVFSLTACDSADYLKAQKLYRSEKYSDAIMIFEDLEDYKDSSQMVLKCKYELALDNIENKDYDSAKELLTDLGDYENCQVLLKTVSWNIFFEYLKDKGGVEIENTSPPYTVTMETSGNDIIASYEIGDEVKESGFGVYEYYKVTLTKTGTNNVLTASSFLGLLGAYSTDEARTIWNTNNYKSGDVVPWTEYSCSGKKIDGTALDPGTTGMAYDSKSALKNFTEGIKKVLDKSGLDIKMCDIGFSSY